MATLQAARAYKLGLPLESAFSWGLNRAIFYAAAKRGFKGKGAGPGHGGAIRGISRGRAEVKLGEFHLGDELAFKQESSSETKPIFTIGGEPQTEEDFKRQIEARFQGSFKEAWKEALDYVGGFDEATLRSQSQFFSTVYRPKRDEFAQKWTETSKGETKRATKVVRAKIK